MRVAWPVAARVGCVGPRNDLFYAQPVTGSRFTHRPESAARRFTVPARRCGGNGRWWRRRWWSWLRWCWWRYVEPSLAEEGRHIVVSEAAAGGECHVAWKTSKSYQNRGGHRVLESPPRNLVGSADRRNSGRQFISEGGTAERLARSCVKASCDRIKVSLGIPGQVGPSREVHNRGDVDGLLSFYDAVCPAEPCSSLISRIWTPTVAQCVQRGRNFLHLWDYGPQSAWV